MSDIVRSFLKFSMIAGVSLSLAGCETGRPVSIEDPQMVASPDKVSMMLAQAADKASTALETLAAVEQRRTPSASIAPITGAPPELMRAVTVNYVGPVDQIVKTMADRASYRFTTLGAAPSTPVVVNIDVTNKPVVEVLRSIGLQLGARADVKVDSESKTVELQYGSTLGAGDVLTPMSH